MVTFLLFSNNAKRFFCHFETRKNERFPFVNKPLVHVGHLCHISVAKLLRGFH